MFTVVWYSIFIGGFIWNIFHWYNLLKYSSRISSNVKLSIFIEGFILEYSTVTHSPRLLKGSSGISSNVTHSPRLLKSSSGISIPLLYTPHVYWKVHLEYPFQCYTLPTFIEGFILEYSNVTYSPHLLKGWFWNIPMLHTPHIYWRVHSGIFHYYILHCYILPMFIEGFILEYSNITHSSRLLKGSSGISSNVRHSPCLLKGSSGLFQCYILRTFIEGFIRNIFHCYTLPTFI